MKKIITIAMAALMCMSCAAKKPVKQVVQQPQVQQVDPQQARLDSLRKAAEIRKLELEIQAAEAQAVADMEIAKLKADNARNAVAMRLGQKIYMPCVDESYDTDEYMAGLGVAENEDERGAGIANANRYAIADITSRYIGMIKNGVSQYTKNVNTRSGQKVKENELEGAAEAIGTKMINKYAKAVCRDAELDKMGVKYTCYVAVHVPLKEVLTATVDELGVIQTDLDRQKFRDYMQAELDKQAAAAQAEKQQLEEMRNQVK